MMYLEKIIEKGTGLPDKQIFKRMLSDMIQDDKFDFDWDEESGKLTGTRLSFLDIEIKFVKIDPSRQIKTSKKTIEKYNHMLNNIGLNYIMYKIEIIHPDPYEPKIMEA